LFFTPVLHQPFQPLGKLGAGAQADNKDRTALQQRVTNDKNSLFVFESGLSKKVKLCANRE